MESGIQDCYGLLYMGRPNAMTLTKNLIYQKYDSDKINMHSSKVDLIIVIIKRM